MPSITGPGSGDDEVDPHRDQADERADQDRAQRDAAMRPPGGQDRERDRDHDVRTERQREPAEQPGDRPRPHRAGVAGANREDGRPQCERHRPVPREGREPDRGHREQRGDDAGADGRRAAPRPGERVQREDDPEVLEQTEGPLGFERVAEHAVPAGEDVERPRTVEVEEVDVRGPAPAARAAGRRA